MVPQLEYVIVLHWSSNLNSAPWYRSKLHFVPPFLGPCMKITRLSMFNQKHFTQSNPAIVFPMDKLKRFLHKANTGRSFHTVAHKNPILFAAFGWATSASQLLAEALQALDDYNSRLQRETPTVDLAHGLIDMSSISSFYKMIQRMIDIKVDLVRRRSWIPNIPRPLWKPWQIC